MDSINIVVHTNISPNKFKLKFPGEVRGPIALSYGVHFDLGLFMGVDDEK